MISREVLRARRCVENLVVVIERVPQRAAVCAPMTLDHETIRWVALWTLLGCERRFLLPALAARGIDLRSLSRGLEELLNARRAADAGPSGPPSGPPPQASFHDLRIDDLLQPVLAETAVEARGLGHRFLGTEHLFLALISRPDDALAALLKRHLVGYYEVRKLVRTLAPPTQPRDVVLEPAVRPVGVPRRFGMAIVLLIMTMYALLFSAMKLFGVHPVAFVDIAVLFTGVGLGQMLLFRGREPRAASIWVGGCLFPVEMLATHIYVVKVAPHEATGTAVLMLLSIPLGIGFGYLSGVLAAGVFLVIERCVKPRHAAPEVDVLGLDEPEKTATRSKAEAGYGTFV